MLFIQPIFNAARSLHSVIVHHLWQGVKFSNSEFDDAGIFQVSFLRPYYLVFFNASQTWPGQRS